MGAASALATVVVHLDSPGSPRCPDGLGRARCTYVRRQPEQTVLHQVVREHLETFLAEARRRGGGEGLPRFVERELREFVTCGVMARGFARFRCDGCAREILVAFSCYAQSETIKSSPLRIGYFVDSFRRSTSDSFSPVSHAMSLSSTWNTPRRSSGGKAFSIASSFSVGSARR
jgi:hypothetical protein